MRNVILHYHLFKNAGSSLDESFKNWLQPGQWVTKEFPGHHGQNRKQVAEWIVNSPEAVCFSSHSAQLPLPVIKGVRVLPVIFIRHPIDRIASAYHFERKQGSDNFGSVLARNTDFNGYIETQLCVPNHSQIINFHCVQFSRSFPAKDGTLFERAVKGADALPFIGVVEDYEGSLGRLEAWLRDNSFPDARLALKISNQNKVRLPKLNQRLAVVRSQLSPSVYQHLMDVNADDLALYEYITGSSGLNVEQANRVVYQYWNREPPAEIAALISTWRTRNTNYEHQLFDDVTALGFMRDNFSPPVVDAYQAITLPAMKCDVLRIALMFKLGGIYMDCATLCHKAIESWCLDDSVPVFLKKRNGRITNSFISAPAGHPLMGEIWQQIEKVLLERTEGNLWLLTGPGLLMSVLKTTQFDYALLQQDDELDHFQLQHNLKHKRANHWSQMQLLIPLFEPARSPLFERLGIYADRLAKLSVYLHIGQHKTGTTSLQHALSSQVLSDGFLYPATGLKFEGHHEWADTLARRNVDSVVGLVDALLAEVDRRGANRIILSSEYFSSKNELEFGKDRMVVLWNNLSAFLRFFGSSSIHYYVREQNFSIDSRMRQAVKSRLCLADRRISRIAENPSLNYSAFDMALRYFFPWCEINAYVYSFSKLTGQCVVDDFGERLGLKLLTDREQNVAISDNDVIVAMLEINARKITVDEKMQLKSDLDPEGIVSENARSLLFGEKDIADVTAKFCESNAEFLLRYNLSKDSLDFKNGNNKNSEVYSIWSKIFTIVK